jgi:hypothetical protein
LRNVDSMAMTFQCFDFVTVSRHGTHSTGAELRTATGKTHKLARAMSR